MKVGRHFSIRTSIFEIRMLRRIFRLIGKNKAWEKLQKVCFTLCAVHKARRISRAEHAAYGTGNLKRRDHLEDLGIDRRINSKISNLEECRLDSSDTGYRPVASSRK
jgi:hypothetical protein